MKQNKVLPSDLPNIDHEQLHQIRLEHLVSTGVSEDPIKILILYGSLRERSYSRFVAQEVDRLVRFLGGETRIFNPKGLQLPDAVDASHEKVQELRDSASWS